MLALGSCVCARVGGHVRAGLVAWEICYMAFGLKPAGLMAKRQNKLPLASFQVSGSSHLTSLDCLTRLPVVYLLLLVQ